MAVAEKKAPCVEYNWLSENCGLKVSNICLGTMTFGTPVKVYELPGNTNKADSIAILNRYAELGGNFLDTANIYNNGESEEIIGSWLSSRDRGSIVVATKVFGSAYGVDESSPNARGLGRGSIMHNVDESLRRLKTDYIDLYYTHCYDEGVKLEETLRAFNDLVRSGKVRYVGLSNFTGGLVQKVMDYNKFMGFNACATLQQEYSLMSRTSDIEVVPACRREGISLIPYSPLACGLLTGKFKRDEKGASATLAGTRLGWAAEKPDERTVFGTPDIGTLRSDERFWKLMDTVEAVGKQHGKSQSQVALRWCLQKDFIPSVIIGAKTIQQLEQNMAAGTGWKLTAEELYEIPGNTNKADSIAILDRYAELGGNFLDTANIYTNGQSEEIIGSWLSSRERGSIVVATKVFAGADGIDDSTPNARGLSRGTIMHNVDESLRRLKTDYIDLYYMHCFDEGVKLEETLRAFNDVVRSGKVRYVGLSNFTGGLVQKVMDYNKFLGFNACVTLQQEYNLASRDSDVEVVPACRREGISLIPYSPLKGGLLTGKFKRDDKKATETLAGTRLGWIAEKPSERALFATPDIETVRNDERFWKLMDTVEAIGKQHGKSPGQVSLRWCLQKDFIPSVIIGAKTIQQLEQNMAAGTGWKLTAEEMKQLDDVSSFAGPIPKYPYNTIHLLNQIFNRTR